MEILVFFAPLILVGAGIYLWFGIFEVPPYEVATVYKRFSLGSATRDPVSFKGEAGYQPKLKMPGWRFVDPIFFRYEKHNPWVKIEPDSIGYVIANIGMTLPPGRKFGKYHEDFKLFADIWAFIKNGGQKGLQQMILPPAAFLPVHPIAFTVITKSRIYGAVSDSELRQKQLAGALTFADFGFRAEDFELVKIGSKKMGLVTCHDGPPLPQDAVACRIGGFADIAEFERAEMTALGINRSAPFAERRRKEYELGRKLLNRVLSSNNHLHENFQNPAKFFELGGTMGPQFYPVGEGSYALNRKLFTVEEKDWVEVKPGEVLVVRSGLGLPAEDVTDVAFEHGSIVQPGHMGTWCFPILQGAYLLDSKVLETHEVKTNLLTLFFNHNKASTHGFDRELESIKALSRDSIDMTFDVDALTVIPEEAAPMMIASFGSMGGFIKDFMAARMVGFATEAVRERGADDIIDNQEAVRESLKAKMSAELERFGIKLKEIIIQETRGDAEYMAVRKAKTIANAKVATLNAERIMENKRQEKERATAEADQEKELARAEKDVAIKERKAEARKKEAVGEAEYVEKTLKAIADALGKDNAMVIQAIAKLAESKHPIVPEVNVSGSGNSGGFASPLAPMILALKEFGVTRARSNQETEKEK